MSVESNAKGSSPRLSSASLHIGPNADQRKISQAASASSTTQTFLRDVADENPSGDAAKTASDNFAIRVNRELRLSTTRDPMEVLDRDKFTLHKLNLKELEVVGREEEIEVLKRDFHQLLQSNSEGSDMSKSRLVTISGCSGTGKTLLAYELRDDTINQQGFFCVGKFDLRSRFEPYTAFAQAVSQLVDQIKQKGEQFEREITSRVQKVVFGADRHVLTEVVPSLAELFGDSVHELTHAPTEASLERRAVRLQVLFCRFVQAVCSNRHPLIVVLDDLQWADSASLDLVEALLTDDDASLFMLVGTFRSNEIDEDHIVAKKLKALESKGVTENRIIVDNLDIDAVRSIVSTVLHSSEELVHSLAMIIHSKTHGNPFFVIRFLESLVDDKLLTFNFGTLQWTWEEGRIRELLVTDNVADLLSSKLNGLSDELQQLLQVSACLGQRFDEETLATAYERVLQTNVFPKVGKDRSNIEPLCDLAVKEGLFQRTRSTYLFAHDQIQEAALNLIHEENHLLMKLRISEGLLQCGAQQDSDHHLFLAVDLCNSAFVLLDEKSKLGLAKYNLLAGQRAMMKSAFFPARQYFQSGLNCLGPDAVTENYKEWLNLTTGIVEATYCCGDIDTMQHFVDIVLSTTCPFEDKIRVYSTQILLLNAQQRFAEAICTGLFVLDKMGMARFPEFPNVLTVIKELTRTKLLMRKYDREKLMNLPELTDKKRIMAMRIIDMMTTATFSTRPNLFLVSFLRSMRWSVKYGVCKYSPTAFATFGVLLSAIGGGKDGVVFGDISLEMSERLKARETMPKTTLLVYGHLRHLTHHLRSCIKPLLYCHQVGMETGDVEVAMIGAVSHYWAVFCTASRPLERLLSDVESHVSRARQYKQVAAEGFGVRLQQLLLNLLGRCVDPLVLTGSAADQEVLYRMAREGPSKNKLAEVEIDCCRLQLAYLLGHYKQAAELSRRTAEIGTKELRGYIYEARIYMYGALTRLALARDGIDRQANVRRAGRILGVINRWSKDGNVNVLHMQKLILAAKASCRSKAHTKAQKEAVTTLFDEAIQCSNRSGFLQDKALCHEWAGLFHLAHGEKNTCWAAYHLGNAVHCYDKWGAKVLVSRLMKGHGKLLESSIGGSDLGDCVLGHSQSRIIHCESHRRNSML